MTSTQQNEAMQAVRLIYDAALSGAQQPRTSANIETLYQARVLLEGFIKSAGVLGSTTIEITDNPENVDNVGWIKGPTFRKGEYIHVLGIRGKITRIDTIRDNLLIQYDSGDCDTLAFSDARRGNPEGSFKP